MTTIPQLLDFKGQHSQAVCTLLSLVMDRKDASSDYSCRATFEQALPVYAASVLKSCVGWTGAWSVKKPALEFATIEVAAADSHRLLRETQMEVRSIDAEPKADGTGLRFVFKVDFLAEENDAIALLQHLKRELIVTVDNQQAALNFAKEQAEDVAALMKTTQLAPAQSGTVSTMQTAEEVTILKREPISEERRAEIIRQAEVAGEQLKAIYQAEAERIVVTVDHEPQELKAADQAPEPEDHAENGTATAEPEQPAAVGAQPQAEEEYVPVHKRRQRGRPRLTEEEKASRKKERDDQEAADRAALLEKKRALDAEHGTSTAPPAKQDPDAPPKAVPAAPAPRAPWRLGEYAHVKVSDGKGGTVRYSGKVFRYLKETDELELQDFEKDPILVPAKLVTRSVNLLGDDRDVDEMIKDYLDIAKLKEKMISWDFIFDALSRAYNEHRLRIAVDGFSYVLEEGDVQTAVAIAPKKPGAKPNVLETATQSQNP